MSRAQLRGTRFYVAWVATRTGRLFFLRSGDGGSMAFSFLAGVGRQPLQLPPVQVAVQLRWFSQSCLQLPPAQLSSQLAPLSHS